MSELSSGILWAIDHRRGYAFAMSGVGISSLLSGMALHSTMVASECVLRPSSDSITKSFVHLPSNTLVPEHVFREQEDLFALYV